MRRNLKPRPALLRAALAATLALAALPADAASQSVTGASGRVAAHDPQSGRYEVHSGPANWTFTGRLGGAASEVVAKDGSDQLGAFHELSFRWKDRVALRGGIRTYVPGNDPVLQAIVSLALQ